MTTFEEVQGKLLTSIGTKAENKDTSSEELAYLAEAMKGIGPSANVTEFASIKTQGVSEVTAALDTLKETIAQAEATLVEDVAKAQRARDNVIAIFGTAQAVDAARTETATASTTAATSATAATTAATASAQSATAADTANKAAQTAKTDTLAARNAAAASAAAADVTAKASAQAAEAVKAHVDKVKLDVDAARDVAVTAKGVAEAARDSAVDAKNTVERAAALYGDATALDKARKQAETSATAASSSATAAEAASKVAQAASEEAKMSVSDAYKAVDRVYETNTAAQAAADKAVNARDKTINARDDAVAAETSVQEKVEIVRAALARLDTETLAKIGTLAGITDMSDAGRTLVGLPTNAAMFEAIKQPASNTSRGVVWVCNEREVMDVTNDRDVITPAMLEYWLQQKKLGGGGMDYSRTGWVSTGAVLVGTGWLTTAESEDRRYIDIPITAVEDYTKCAVTFIGGVGVDPVTAMLKTSTNATGLCTARLTSNTNLRISSILNFSTLVGRWTVGAPS